MRRFLTFAALAVLLLAGAAIAQISWTSEVLVQTTPTVMPRLGGLDIHSSYGFEVQNNGPNDEYCSIGPANTDGGANVYDDGGPSATVGIARDVTPGGGLWSSRVGAGLNLYCVAKAAAQLTTAATVLTEVP